MIKKIGHTLRWICKYIFAYFYCTVAGLTILIFPLAVALVALPLILELTNKPWLMNNTFVLIFDDNQGNVI